MKFEELKAKNIAELQKEQNDLLKELFSLRMQKGLGEAPKTHSFKEIRKNIARIKTLITEKKKAEKANKS